MDRMTLLEELFDAVPPPFEGMFYGDASDSKYRARRIRVQHLMKCLASDVLIVDYFAPAFDYTRNLSTPELLRMECQLRKRLDRSLSRRKYLHLTIARDGTLTFGIRKKHEAHTLAQLKKNLALKWDMHPLSAHRYARELALAPVSAPCDILLAQTK